MRGSQAEQPLHSASGAATLAGSGPASSSLSPLGGTAAAAAGGVSLRGSGVEEGRCAFGSALPSRP